MLETRMSEHNFTVCKKVSERNYLLKLCPRVVQKLRICYICIYLHPFIFEPYCFSVKNIQQKYFTSIQGHSKVLKFSQCIIWLLLYFVLIFLCQNV